MRNEILRRVGISLLIVIAVSIVVFAPTLLLPDAPGRMDESPFSQYFGWLAGLLDGKLLGAHVINTLVLLVAAVIIATPLGVLIGIASARRRLRRQKHRLHWLSLVLTALPEFIVGLALLGIYAIVVLPILPAVSAPGTQVWESPIQLVLPWATLVLVATPYVVRTTRSALVEAPDSAAVEMARLKGVPENQVVTGHVLPHTIGPVAKAIAVQLTWLISGVVIIEYLFQYPGIGQALVAAVTQRDVPVVQAIALLVVVACVVVHLLAQLVDVAANPRLRRTHA